MRRDIQLRGAVSSVVTTGVAAAAAPAPEARNKAFEAARDASKQRAAVNLNAADEVDQLKKESTRRIGARVFVLRNQIWTDLRRSESTRVVKVKPFSEAYFKIIDVIPELREVFALGDKVIVTGRDVAIEIGPAGAETLSDSELRRIQSGW